MSALYFHIPFCLKMCGYCDFYRSVKLQFLPRVVEMMHRELDSECDFLHDAGHCHGFGGILLEEFPPRGHVEEQLLHRHLSGLVALDDGGEIAVDEGKAGGCLHARRGVDAPVGQGTEAILIVIQDAPSHDGESGINTEYDHSFLRSILYQFIITQNPPQVKGFFTKNIFCEIFQFSPLFFSDYMI